MTVSEKAAAQWPALPYDQWKDTLNTLHMWTQIVGKVKLELAPFLNQLWEVGFHVSPRGFRTGLIPYHQHAFEVQFDLVDHHVSINTDLGDVRTLALIPRSVADFYRDFMGALQALGIEVKIHTTPNEVPNPIPFPEDQTHASYDASAARRFHQILVQTAKVMQRYRAPFIGKSSPILFYWGSFDLSEARYSGKQVTPPSGPRFYKLAEDEENIACGFWPGNATTAGELGKPAFYSYTSPAPQGFKDAQVRPSQAHFDEKLGEFILLYDDARQSSDPAQTILEFFQSAYEAGAALAGWDRQRLEKTPWKP